MPDEPHLAMCGTCGGRIYRPARIGGGRKKFWLHINESDWKDNPHNAEPKREDQSE